MSPEVSRKRRQSLQSYIDAGAKRAKERPSIYRAQKARFLKHVKQEMSKLPQRYRRGKRLPVEILEKYVPGVIGVDREIINLIQQQSGATIVVPDVVQVSRGQDVRVFEITGEDEQIALAYPLLINALYLVRRDEDPSIDQSDDEERPVRRGIDPQRWLVLLKNPDGDLDRDEIVNGHVKTLAKVVGSEREAKQKMYSILVGDHYGFGAQISQEQAKKLREMPEVFIVVPDCGDYPGEPYRAGNERNHEE